MKQSTKQKLEALADAMDTQGDVVDGFAGEKAASPFRWASKQLEQIIKEDEEPAKRNSSGGYYLSEGELQEIQKTEINK